MTVLALAIDDIRYSIRRHFWTGRTAILQGVSLDVEPGEIFGFLGPNGAGKTTTIKAIIDLIRLDSGSIRLLGSAPGEVAVRRRIGYMPEHAYFPEYLTVRELLLGHGLLSGLTIAKAHESAAEILERVGLSHAAGRRLGTYSKGMLQRAGLAQALVGDPDLVILDEPMSGLDPLGRRDIRDIMTGLRDRGKTVFFSTHILPDVEMICDKVAIIVGGKSRKLGRLDELLGLSVQGADVLAASCSGRVRDDAAAHSLRVEDRQSAVLFEAASVDDANRIVDLLRGAGVTVLGLQVRRQSLEDLFIDEATGNVDGAAS